ncbi:cytochrome c oxidase subunit 7B, mitochondrial-like [Canis lupus familiaris]|nr:cytochrome c oxidase subunit 7B, mitochondrial-like [Canis lupus familiaris]XP_038415183.1 cytochrome c oxidase subunit 7B, mitochondrial-like [Canis lupus familiaris]XP_038544896.1 cytochrome c oxidase subunit 7B, mitochondrial-like [Canis lupus familiaris]
MHLFWKFVCCFTKSFYNQFKKKKKNALSRLRVQSIPQTMARQSHQKRAPDFHDKYGNAVLASGATFCIAVWAYTATQIGIEWNLSPVGRVTPKEWRDQ